MDVVSRKAQTDELNRLSACLGVMMERHRQGYDVRQYVPVMEYILCDIRRVMRNQNEKCDNMRRQLAISDPFFMQGMDALDE